MMVAVAAPVIEVHPVGGDVPRKVVRYLAVCASYLWYMERTAKGCTFTWLTDDNSGVSSGSLVNGM